MPTAVNLLRITTLCLFLLGVVGCLDLGEAIHIHRDGSATVRMQLRVSPALQGVIGRTPGLRPMAMLMEPAALSDALPSGVTLRNAYHFSEGSRQVYVNELFIADVQGVETGSSPVFKGQSFAVAEKNDGAIHYTRTVDYSQFARDPELAAMLRENRMGVRGILAQAPFRFELKAPLGIQSTNGTLDDDTIVWEYTLLEMLRGPVTQEVVFASPTLIDMALAAGRIVFRPQVFPFAALVFLGLFFGFARRPRPVSS